MAGRLLRAAAVAVTLEAICACAPSGAALDRAYEQAQESMRRGQIDEALAAAEQGVSRSEQATDQVRAWRFRLLVADARLTKLEYPAAMAVLEQRIPEVPELAPLRGRQLYLLARAKVSQGQLPAAEPLMAEAARLAGSDPALTIDLELLESQWLYRSGRAADADALLAAARTRVAAEGDRYRLAQISNNIGLGLVTRGRYDEALPSFVSVIDDPAVAGMTVQGLAFNNAGICYARLGQFGRAVAAQEQAIRIQEKGRRQNYAQALGELGGTYLLQDDFTRAVEYLQRAFSIAAGAGLATDAALFARNLAAAFVVMGRWDEAARFTGEALTLASQNPAAASPYTTVTRAQVAAGRGDAAEADQLFREALAAPKAPPGVRWVSLNGLARIAAASGRPKDAAGHFEAALQLLEETRSALLRADYRISFTSRLIQFYQGYVDLLLSQGQVERALEVADSSRARVLAERQGIAAPAARASAAALKRLASTMRSTLLFYWLGPERSWAWTVTGDRISAVALPARSEIETLVTEHQSAIQNALSDPLQAPGSAGERLYQALIVPLGLNHPGAVVIVPDGALHQVNFETLVVADTKGAQSTGAVAAQVSPRRYWIEDVTVQIAPSLAMLQVAARPSAASLLLVGNAAARPPDFPALSYAAAEMTGIRRHFPAESVTVIGGDGASPAAFKDAQPGRFGVIHFTSHAVANVESPLDSAVILSGPDSGYKLYAREVAALPLAAELVTVSACRSAGDRAYAGEGLVGFAWAFLRAGSRRVVAGLWDVDDRSTATLMDHLYARVAAGEDPAAALREAKLALMKGGYPRPYYWAPFELFTVVL